LKYDYLVVAAGTVSTSFGITGVDEHALPLKTLHDRSGCARLPGGVRARRQRGRRRPAAADLSIVVVGGPTGVEIAGGLLGSSTTCSGRTSRNSTSTGLSITLVEAAPACSHRSIRKSSKKAEQTLARRGVRVITGVGVDRRGRRRRVADGQRLPRRSPSGQPASSAARLRRCSACRSARRPDPGAT
jgi:NADH dehydrogenase